MWKQGLQATKIVPIFLSNVDTLECCCERKRKFFACERKSLKYEGKLQNWKKLEKCKRGKGQKDSKGRLRPVPLEK